MQTVFPLAGARIRSGGKTRRRSRRVVLAPVTAVGGARMVVDEALLALAKVVLAQRARVVLLAEQAPALQFRHTQVDEASIVDRRVDREIIEAVDAALDDPSLELVG